MIKVLMFGWEFPPFKSGGLGTACYDLANGLSKQKVKIAFVMPFANEHSKANYVKLVSTAKKMQGIKLRTVNSPLTPYMTSEIYEYTYGASKTNSKIPKKVYGKNLLEEVNRFSEIAKRIAKEETHDIIHVHDWMTYQAGINAKKISGKPLIAHLHATEFDRTGGNPDPRISHIEYKGLKACDKVITNSEFSKQNIIKHYKINPAKIEVVHWSISEHAEHKKRKTLRPEINTILFLGRITIQKGPDYFLQAAKKIVQYAPNTRFVIVGQGDKLPDAIHFVAKEGLADKFIFTGWLKGKDVHKAFQEATLYVMPSVAEPFGLVALESLKNNTPIMVSKTSGVSEVIQNALKVDFWDVNDMVDKIVSVLRHSSLHKTLQELGKQEVDAMTLDIPARKVREVYRRALA